MQALDISLKMSNMQKLAPCLWFNDQAHEAAKFYVSIFKKKSKIVNVARYGEGGPGPQGSVMMVSFTLGGRDFLALNGGPAFTFSPAISLSVSCQAQKEVDHYWKTLRAGGGSENQCGWLQDKYGLSWQIVPTILAKLLQDKDRNKSNRVMTAMLQMKKLDIAALKAAAAAEPTRKRAR